MGVGGRKGGWRGRWVGGRERRLFGQAQRRGVATKNDIQAPNKGCNDRLDACRPEPRLQSRRASGKGARRLGETDQVLVCGRLRLTNAREWWSHRPPRPPIGQQLPYQSSPHDGRHVRIEGRGACIPLGQTGDWVPPVSLGVSLKFSKASCGNTQVGLGSPNWVSETRCALTLQRRSA